MVVVLATLATYLFSWDDAPYNVKVLGYIPSGLPVPAIPSFPNVSYRRPYTGNQLPIILTVMLVLILLVLLLLVPTVIMLLSC